MSYKSPNGPACEIGYDKITIVSAATSNWYMTTLDATKIPISTNIELSFVIPAGNNAMMLGFSNMPSANYCDDGDVYYGERAEVPYSVRRFYSYYGDGSRIYWYSNTSQEITSYNNYNGVYYAIGDKITITRMGNEITVYENDMFLLTDNCPSDFQYIQITTEIGFPVPLEISVKLGDE
jgi:hypothetical protein